MMNHLQPSRRKKSWKRFIVYFLIALISYLVLRSIYHAIFGSGKQAKKDKDHFKDHLHHNNNKFFTKEQSILEYSPNNDTYLDFPWYQTEHTRPQFKPNATILTTHLSPKQRQILEQTAILQAKKLAYAKFPQVQYQTIRGSPLTSEETEDLRFKLDCWTRGEWIREANETEVYRLKHVQDPIYSSCDRQFYKTHPATEVREATKYRWQPSSPDCPVMKPVESRKWCRSLQGRHWLVVGDLVQYQYHEVLLDAFRDEPTVCFGELNCKDHTICKWPRDTRLRYIRNDILSSVRSIENRDDGHPLGNVVEWPFVTTNLLTTYPVIFLSRTTVLGDDDLSFTRRLIQTMKVIRDTSPDAIVIYRSAFIGHPFCNDAQKPLDKNLTDEELKRLPFGWSESKRRNKIAKAIVEASGGIYLDLASMIDLRPDGHVGNRDCSRYCIPGPLDATIQILYNLFLNLKLPKQTV